jgi:hypothetical protein
MADIINGATTSNQVSVTTKAISGTNRRSLDGPKNSATFTLIQASNGMITNGAVSNTKIGANAIGSSKIADGSIVAADVSQFFITKVHRPDLNCATSD